jgi:hypothetical protein
MEKWLPAVGIAMAPTAFVKRALNKLFQIRAIALTFAIHITEAVQKVLEGNFRSIQPEMVGIFYLDPLHLEL